MSGYYAEKLSALQLRQCYEIAPPRVRQYLEAEVNHVCGKIHPGDRVLELGCGYGRIFHQVADKAGFLVGIDTSRPSLGLAQEILSGLSNCYLMAMDAVHLGFRDRSFDVIVCIQNGISAFHVNQKELIRESLRVAKPGGTILFSSYSDKFWDDRMEWFRMQSEAGLLGEIDEEKTGNGVIVCKDGFTATTIRPEDFHSFTSGLDGEVSIVEVDESSLFCEIIPHERFKDF